ncbi:MAG TPA: family 16 glycosylhydrolase [Verrucomicrobiae bacterium]|nr:family 16 glycosylhydrolase [Verrucomicrobiae bacterium]
MSVETLLSPVDVFATQPPGYYLVWSDEFNGSSLNTTDWQYARNGSRSGAYDTSAAVNVTGGNLVITTYTEGGTNFTGFIDTQNHIWTGYGYYEASIQFSNAPGNSSAFWLQSPWMMNVMADGTLGNTNNNPTNGVEIDIFEHIDVTGINNQTPYSNGGDSALWWNGYGSQEQGREIYSSPNLNVGTGFHTYGFLWTPNGYTFYLDGKVTGTSRSSDMISSALQFIRLTSGVDYSSSWDGTVPPGGYPDKADSQLKMLVDYVRYYAPASARAVFWTGAASAYWTNSANWVSNQAPGADSDLMFTYQCTGNRNMALGQDISADSLVFLPSTGAFSITDTNTLTLGAGGIDMSEANNNVMLTVPVNLIEDQTWSVGINNPGNVLMDNGDLSGSATLTKSSFGTLVLNGANSFSGTLNVDTGSSSNDDGTVNIASAAAVKNLAAIAIRNTGVGVSTLVLSNNIIIPCPLSLAGRNNSVASIACASGYGALAGGLTLTGGGSNYVIQSDSSLYLYGTISADSGAIGARALTLQGIGSFTIPGSIQNGSASAISLVKSNLNSLTLSGVNTYTGGTTNWSGTIFVNGSLMGPLAINGGTLSGTGTIGGNTVIEPGCELAPGRAIANAIGTLSFGGNLTLSSDSVTYLEINAGPPATNDQINVTGTMHCGGALYVQNLGGTLTPGQSFRLFNFGARSGSFSTLTLPPLNAGLIWNTNNLANGIISVIAVSPAETLAISNSENSGMQVYWNYGILQTATNVAGPYHDVSNINPPFVINPTDSQQFYRIKEN